MKESISSTFTLSLIVLFIVVVIGILTATLSYYKAFKVNNRILSEVEKYEGWNKSAEDNVNDLLASLGYPANSTHSSCPGDAYGADLKPKSNPGRLYCVYYHNDDRGKNEKDKLNQNNDPIYYNYSVITYIYIQLPVVGLFKIPVYTKGERTYHFSCKKCTDNGKCTISSSCGSGGHA